MIKEIKGKKFNNLTFIENTQKKNKFGNYIWKCLCECGKNVELSRGAVTAGSIKSCGCLRTKNIRKRKFLDLKGKRFGRILVLNFAGYIFYTKKRYRPYWNCLCDCGIKYKSTSSSIKKSQSCGCLQKETMIKNRRIAPGKSGFNLLKSQYKYGARARNLSFNLNDSQLEVLFKQNCNYCNIEPKQKSVPNNAKTIEAKEHSQYIYNGIDRLHNNVGYELQNCVPCCKICNNAKSDLSIKDFSDWILRICVKAVKNAIRSGNSRFLYAIPKFW